MEITIKPMTMERNRTYWRSFHHDPMMFTDTQPFCEYAYSVEKADAAFERHKQLERIHMAVMRGEEPIGEIVLKNLDPVEHCCTMGIHLANDSCKDKGYGTKAEFLLLKYAFEELGMCTVYADALHKNKRSQHVLEKVGFVATGSDELFRYYRCDKATWNPQKLAHIIQRPQP